MLRQLSVMAALALAAATSPAFANCEALPMTQEGRSGTAPVLKEIRDLIGTEFYRKDVRQRYAGNPAEAGADLGRSQDPCELIDREIAELDASHTRHYRADQIDYYEMVDTYGPTGLAERYDELFAPVDFVHYAGIGAVTTPIEGRPFVSHIYQGSPAERAGLKRGDEIVTVDGQPYREITSFKGKTGSKATLAVRRTEGGEPFDIEVDVIDIKPNELLVEAVRQSARIIETEGAKVGYVRLWTYSRPEITPMLTELLGSGVLADADVLVLDMRGRWGGAPPDAGELFLGGTHTMSIVDDEGQEQPVMLRWRKPVVGLIDAGARSGMEVLAYALQKGGVPLVGETTAGAVLAGRPFILSDHSVLLLAVRDVLVNGERLEGIGVTPDVEVSAALAYAAGSDAQLDRAIEEARRLARN